MTSLFWQLPDHTAREVTRVKAPQITLGDNCFVLIPILHRTPPETQRLFSSFYKRYENQTYPRTSRHIHAPPHSIKRLYS